MTDKEKAKAYDEAIEKAKSLYEQAKKDDSPIWATYEYLFPQLAESEDDRIIQFFAELATDACGGPGQEYYEELGLNYDKVMTWLEKKKEQEPIKVEVYEVGKGTTICGQDYKCKKDYKEGNCWYIKDVIYHCSRDGYLTDQNGISWSCTPEWFKEYIQSNAEWAEEEKTRFVSGQFLQCKLSFDGFKEGEHYWLEYIGDDMYVGRSDNILNHRFHITPRQLYTLFSQQLDEVQGPPEEEKQRSLNYEPPFNENPSDKEIIEALIKHLKEQDGFLTAINCVSTKAILNWLKKQKEQKLLKVGENAYFDPNTDMWFIKKEQKPTEPSDDELQRHQDELYDFKVFAAKQAKEHHISFVHDFEWDNFCGELLSYFNEKQKPMYALTKDQYVEKFRSLCDSYDIKLPNRTYDIYHLCDDLAELFIDSGKHKPVEWSDEDEVHRTFILESLEDQIRFCKKDAEGAYYAKQIRTAKNWFKSLPERFNLQPKKEWNDEDKKMLVSIINDFRNGNVSSIGQEQWLKSLPERFNPQPKQELGEVKDKLNKIHSTVQRFIKDIK